MGRRFEEFGFPLHEHRGVIPDDDTTLFVCSGMQQLKPKFKTADGTTYGSLQSCIRTNDIDLIGDGSHLTSFVMVGNFSFNGPSYEHSVEMWTAILGDLFNWDAPAMIDLHVHPDRDDHRKLWDSRGFVVLGDPECVWSDGDIGGHCCEVYYDALEIGNLVNPLGHSTDVGFGLERLLQVLEGKGRVDETSLFDQSLHPVVRDHSRTLRLMRENGITPGNKGREYVCRRLLRRMMRHTDGVGTGVCDWIMDERELLAKRLVTARKLWRKHQGKPPEWWWDTCGVFPEEVAGLKDAG